MNLYVNCVIISKRKTPARREKHEFLPKSSNEIENKILQILHKKETELFTLCTSFGIMGRGLPKAM